MCGFGKDLSRESTSLKEFLNDSGKHGLAYAELYIKYLIQPYVPARQLRSSS
jgi:hypothetical protein